MEQLEQILSYFPEQIKNKIMENISSKLASFVEEIRIRNQKPIVIKIAQEMMIINYIISNQEIEEIFDRICQNSIYSYRKQICEGFITVKGGHRIGITGNVVLEEEKIININYISSLNFRIAREIKHCSQKILDEVIDIENNTIYNTLIIAPPGCGKTTILRDIIRTLSNGESKIEPKVIGLVDERGEIAAMYKGMPQNDIGIMTDVINNISKEKGMKMLIRSMAPQIIACDEIGSKKDVEAILLAISSGVKGIFTTHGENINQIQKNKELKELLKENRVQKIVVLDKNIKGEIKQIYNLENNKNILKIKNI